MMKSMFFVFLVILEFVYLRGASQFECGLRKDINAETLVCVFKMDVMPIAPVPRKAPKRPATAWHR